MDWRTPIHATVRLLRNRFLWGGLAALIIVGLGVYLAFDRLLMPSVTRHGVSVVVPDVMAMPPERADSVLTAAGLSMEQQVLRKLNLPRNEIMDQRPPPGSQVKPGRNIYVTVNTGDTTTVRVPLVVGRSRRDVSGYLSDFGLTVGTMQRDSIRSTRPRDVISRQSPREGTRMPRGSAIRLWYSMGPSAEFVLVPDVSGLSTQEATARLQSAGLRSVVLGASTDPVLDQGPAAGTTVREGSEVRLRTRSSGSGG